MQGRELLGRPATCSTWLRLPVPSNVPQTGGAHPSRCMVRGWSVGRILSCVSPRVEPCAPAQSSIWPARAPHGSRTGAAGEQLFTLPPHPRCKAF